MSVISRFVFLFIAMLLMSSNSSAANFFCDGVPSEVVVWGNGSDWVAVKLSGYDLTWVLCDLNNDHGGVSAKSCNAMHSVALSALAANKIVRLKFSTQLYESCAAVPAWNVDVPQELKMLHIVR